MEINYFGTKSSVFIKLCTVHAECHHKSHKFKPSKRLCEAMQLYISGKPWNL